MKTAENYWNMTEEQRGSLTYEEIELIHRAALMEQGIVRPDPPVDGDLPPAPQLDMDTLFMVSTSAGRYGSDTANFGFKTMAQAEAFRALEPVFIDSEYIGHESVRVPNAKGIMTITNSPVATRASFDKSKAAITSYSARKNAIVQARSEYDTAMRKVEEAVTPIREDYERCLRVVRKLTEVRTKLQEYLGLCNGDADVARNFLEKAYGEELVKQALGERMPACSAS